MTNVLLEELPGSVSFPQEEERIHKYWKDNQSFEKSYEKSKGRKPYSFYDGPPFATGKPHYGHILAGTIKDVACRWAHQTGHCVERRFGWDCHGLPIEFEIEKELGIKTKDEILAMGIGKYNDHCRSIVTRYVDLWEERVSRMGRWIDFKNDYKTMNIDYMESVWWVFKSLFEKNLVYRGVKVMPYSTACTTPLSNFEANQDYKDVSDPSVVVTFPLVEDPETKLLAWTTTPWTLPSNLALCVHPDLDYIKLRDLKTNNVYVLAQLRLAQLYPTLQKDKEKKDFKLPYEELAVFKGKDLEGKEYQPLFTYFESWKEHGAFKVLNDTYVTSESGTGIVHQAPGFGVDDYRVCNKYKITSKHRHPVCPIDESGRYTEEVADMKGKPAKGCDDDICKRLKDAGRLVSKAAIVHSYPHCWRSGTPLLYKCVASWFVNVEKIKPNLIATTNQTEWVPDFVKSKRFMNWLEDAVDWCVSRSRYWGTPLPLWVSEDFEEVVCVGSVAELEELTGKKFTDIHRQFIDDVTIPSKQGKGVLRRVPEVFDCWFESGSMPYAQNHYPFENKEKFEASFPADFIAEGLDQTRGWFYTLQVLAAALFDKPAFKNVCVNGLVLAADGKKMSKRLQNYPEPTLVVDQHTADAVRLYLLSSPAVRAEPLRFQEAGVKEVVKTVTIPVWNATKFFVENYNRFVKKGGVLTHSLETTNVMDKWILANSASLIKSVRFEMERYHLYRVLPKVLDFLNNLTNWYVRMNRHRLKGTGDDADWAVALNVLFHVLHTSSLLLAPFMPFLAENVYQRLKPLLPENLQEESVHMCMIPEVDEALADVVIERKVKRMQNVINLVRPMRERGKIPLKTPLTKIIIVQHQPEYLSDIQELIEYVKSEANALEVELTHNEGEYVTLSADANMKPMLDRLGDAVKPLMGAIQKQVKALTHDDVHNYWTQETAEGSARTLKVGEHTLHEDEVKVVRKPKAGQAEHYEVDALPEVLVLVDKRTSEKSRALGLEREFTSAVQQLRKAAKLTVNDRVAVWWTNVDGDAELETIIESAKENIQAKLHAPLAKAADIPAEAVKIEGAATETKVGGKKVALVLTQPLN